MAILGSYLMALKLMSIALYQFLDVFVVIWVIILVDSLGINDWMSLSEFGKILLNCAHQMLTHYTPSSLSDWT